jgi:hypothetical protein
VAKPDDLWIPLVDEPIGTVVQDVQREHPDIDALVSGPQRILAFRTFAYIRVGMLLGQLLVESDDADQREDETWVDALLRRPEHYQAIVREVRAVAEEIAADPHYAADEPVGPDDAARARFREFARKQLG